MTDLTEQKILQSIQDRKATFSDFKKKVSTFIPLLELEKQAFKTSALDHKTKELMALSISIVTKCEPCMEWHLHQALQANASDEEIYETIDVAIEMGGGQAAAYARYVIKALHLFRTA